MSSNSVILIVLVIALLAAAIIAGASYYRRQRTRHLRDQFGPEYARLAEETGSRHATERTLLEREKRAETFNIRPLDAEDRSRFIARWQTVQAEFVDNPKGSLSHADDLLGEVMAARGYPVADFEQRTADLSVDHPLIVQHYHAAHHVALAHRREEAGTEDLRQAMIHYRAMFDELVSEPPHARAAE